MISLYKFKKSTSPQKGSKEHRLLQAIKRERTNEWKENQENKVQD